MIPFAFCCTSIWGTVAPQFRRDLSKRSYEWSQDWRSDRSGVAKKRRRWPPDPQLVHRSHTLFAQAKTARCADVNPLCASAPALA
jgi:hypothetical protein